MVWPAGAGVDTTVTLCGQQVCMSTNETFACQEMPNLILGVEICEDLWAPEPPLPVWPAAEPPLS